VRSVLRTARARPWLAVALLLLIAGGASLASGDLGAGRGRAYRTPAQLAALLDQQGGEIVVDTGGKTLVDKHGHRLHVGAHGALVDSKGRLVRDASGHVVRVGKNGTLPSSSLQNTTTTQHPGKQHAKHRLKPGAGGKSAIVVGVAFNNAQKLDQIYARYGGKARASDGGLDSRAVADYINSTGGIDGHKLVLRLREYDTTDGRPYDVTFAEVCQWFAQGEKPVAVITIANDDELAPCLSSHGIPLINDWPNAGSTWFEARFPSFFFQPGSLALDRMAVPYVSGLKDQGFFAGSTKVGLLRYSDPDFDAAANRALKPALTAAGVKLTAEEAIPVTKSVNDLSGLLSHVANAVVRFRARGVNRIVSLDDTGQVVGLFAQAAGPQGYYPRYGLSSQNSPLFIRSSLSPKDVHGAVGIGWSPITDVAAGQEGALPATRVQCMDIFRRAGIQEIGDRSAYGQFGAFSRCSNLLMLRKALAAHAASSPAALRASLEALGGGFDSAVTMQTSLSGSRHDGAIGYRYLHFDDGCACFVYSGGARTIG
jgi:ABC-type branched-subunit amino acid transport system substrate-binding protein